MKMIVNCETGEVIERQLNKAEKDQEKIDEAKYLSVKAIIEAEAEAKAIVKQTIADRLGLTADELQSLLG
jgi:F0F1-type ATP synthase membrane subunit b/b'